MICHAQTRFHHWLLRNIATAWAEQEPQASKAFSMSYPTSADSRTLCQKRARCTHWGEALEKRLHTANSAHLTLSSKDNLGRRHDCNSSTLSGDADWQPQYSAVLTADRWIHRGLKVTSQGRPDLTLLLPYPSPDQLSHRTNSSEDC